MPPTKADPLEENWTITGLLSLPAVSMTAFIEFVPMQFAAGSANWFAFARAKISLTASPVWTPAGKSFLKSVTRRA